VNAVVPGAAAAGVRREVDALDVLCAARHHAVLLRPGRQGPARMITAAS
jgi:hypothetical protein